MDSLNAYARAFDRALRRGSEFARFNRDMNHATIIVCTAMSHAKANVWLLSHRLDPVLYGGQWFREAAEGFLGRRSGRIHIVVESELADEHPMVALAHKYPGKVTIKRVPDDLLERYRYNFMVVDDSGYRFEHDRDKYEALVVFHDSDQAHGDFIATLKARYEELAAHATDVPMQKGGTL